MQSVSHIERSIASQDWIFLALSACLVILALLRSYHGDSFTSFLQLPLSNKYFLVAGKKFTVIHPFTLILFLVNLIITSLFLVLVLHYLVNPEFTIGLPLFFQTLASVLGFVSVRLLIEKLVGTVFGIESLINQYLFEKLTYQNLIALLLGIASILFLWLFKESVIVLYLALGAVIVGYTISLFYSFKSNEKLIFGNFFYFILYLCALEISPFILVYKVLV